ncbi:MAG: hypothetical protein UW44_C0021G0010 [Candidatus Collierbacteria bacterium GW2011_GWB2_44_22]|uniref:Uncharacterized protein n=1 Tax=Candidatus Collierbacteria bacterium GW2011_GWB2_44_22 TaxID=1618387 RepID=A0A0G1KSS4_9BACT|nr:MAG: hypothetical protein UW44_C0021G0010 [Candidatus Collierbacteria bacterium GW2011_GWB2_44_22]
MSDNFPIVFKGSPFLPVFDHDGLIERVIQDLLVGHTHATTLDTYRVSETDLHMLVLGYLYPIETILASAVCLPLDPSEWPSTYEELLSTTHGFDLLRLQDQVFKDLRATINLLKMDPSGALIFQYLKDYPFSTDEFFLTGMEIAAMIFFGISLEVARKTGDDSWLNTPIPDPNITE